ncbi:MAG: MGMT family protein [Candidatus Moraniibacteriota bacterium]
MHLPPKASYQQATSLTAFRRAVYSAVSRIPEGEVRTYSQVARLAGFPGAARAVGTAMSENRYRDVPCHRVIRADGSVGEYAFGGERAKALRLKAEGVEIIRQRVIFPA